MSQIFNPEFLPNMVVLWFGVAANVPAGWAICDGTNGTPDMRGRVPVGVDTSQAEFDVLGEAGGAKTHALVTAEVAAHTHTGPSHTHTGPSHTHTGPDHNHFLNLADPSAGTSNANVVRGTPLQITSAAAVGLAGTGPTGAAGTGATGADGTGASGSTGSGTAHNNLQPYRALHFIMKL